MKRKSPDGFLEYRKGQVLHYLRLLAASADKRRFSYCKEEIDAVFSPIDEAVESAKLAFGGIIGTSNRLETPTILSDKQSVAHQISFDETTRHLVGNNSDKHVKQLRRFVRMEICPLCNHKQEIGEGSCKQCGAVFIKRHFIKT